MQLDKPRTAMHRSDARISLTRSGPPSRLAAQRTCGSAAPNSADLQRWGTASAARTVPRIDWNELLGVSCNRLLDGGHRGLGIPSLRDGAAFEEARDLGLWELGELRGLQRRAALEICERARLVDNSEQLEVCELR